MEKEFDLIGILSDTSKNLEEGIKRVQNDAVALPAKKEMLDEVINFINTNKLKVVQVVEETPAEETPVETEEKAE